MRGRVNCYVEPKRTKKTGMILGAVSAGCGGRMLMGQTEGSLPDADHHIVWGYQWVSVHVIQQAARQGQHSWLIDNAYWRPGRGMSTGFYRAMMDQPVTPFISRGRGYDRARRVFGVRLHPWHREGRNVVIMLPGDHFGDPWNMDMHGWSSRIEARVREHTDRPVIVRAKGEMRSLEEDFKDAWCIVTHSSGVAVTAACAGIPVFCEPTCAAAYVGRTDLHIESPVYHEDRERWVESLAFQQFSLPEYRSGFARDMLQAVIDRSPQ